MNHFPDQILFITIPIWIVTILLFVMCSFLSSRFMNRHRQRRMQLIFVVPNYYYRSECKTNTAVKTEWKWMENPEKEKGKQGPGFMNEFACEHRIHDWTRDKYHGLGGFWNCFLDYQIHSLCDIGQKIEFYSYYVYWATSTLVMKVLK